MKYFSFQELEQNANAGDAKAQFDLYIQFLNGPDFKWNLGKALHYLERSADQDYVEAQYELASWYYNGSAAKPRDRAKAIQYYERAADLGHSKSLLSLAQHYEKVGAPDLDKAITYYRLASAKGETKASMCLIRLFQEAMTDITQMTGQDVNDAHARFFSARPSMSAATTRQDDKKLAS